VSKPSVVSRGVSKTRRVVGKARRTANGALVRRRTPRLEGTDGIAVVRGFPLVLPDAEASPVAKRIISLGYTEPKFTAMVERVLSPGQVVADVGASIGYFTCLMAQSVGPKGRVIAFEPWPKALRYLRHNIEVNHLERVTVVPAAAFDESGHAHLGPPRYRLTMGSKRPADAVDVRVERFDDFAEIRELPRLDAIKMDIEGAELRALRGMTATLARWKPLLLMEVHPTFLQVYDDSLEALYSFLGDLDYAYAPVEGPLSGDDGFHIAAAPVQRLYSHGLVPVS
jgi:FkbM family methyltransferase